MRKRHNRYPRKYTSISWLPHFSLYHPMRTSQRAVCLWRKARHHCSQGTSSSPIGIWNHPFLGLRSENVTVTCYCVNTAILWNRVCVSSLVLVYSDLVRYPSKTHPLFRLQAFPSLGHLHQAKRFVSLDVNKDKNWAQTIVTSRTSNVLGFTVPKRRWKRMAWSIAWRTSFVLDRSKVWLVFDQSEIEYSTKFAEKLPGQLL